MIAALFEVDVRTVSEHLGNLFASGEQVENAVIRKFRTTVADGKGYNTKFYIDATAMDYSAAAETTQPFFATVQNKLDFAIHRVVQDRLFESDFDRAIKQLPKKGSKP